jgi:hypothetical protein
MRLDLFVVNDKILPFLLLTEERMVFYPNDAAAAVVVVVVDDVDVVCRNAMGKYGVLLPSV